MDEPRPREQTRSFSACFAKSGKGESEPIMVVLRCEKILEARHSEPDLHFGFF